MDKNKKKIKIMAALGFVKGTLEGLRHNVQDHQEVGYEKANKKLEWAIENLNILLDE